MPVWPHKTQMDWSRNEVGPSRLEVDDLLPQPWYGLFSIEVNLIYIKIQYVPRSKHTPCLL
jgi:hypothetical protein